MNVEKKNTIRWINLGSKKVFFPTFFLKWQGHFEGPDCKPFVILARVLVDFEIVFGPLFSDIWKWPKTVKNGPGGCPPGSAPSPDSVKILTDSVTSDGWVGRSLTLVAAAG